jgi:hypothetical protein
VLVGHCNEDKLGVFFKKKRRRKDKLGVSSVHCWSKRFHRHQITAAVQLAAGSCLSDHVTMSNCLIKARYFDSSYFSFFPLKTNVPHKYVGDFSKKIRRFADQNLILENFNCVIPQLLAFSV